MLRYDLGLVEELSFAGRTPWQTRQLLQERGKDSEAKIVALTVGCRGTNLDKIRTRSTNDSVAQQVCSIATKLTTELGLSLSQIAAAYPEVVYDARVRSGSPISVNTLSFLKHNGLTKEEWLKANEEFCQLVGADFRKFLNVSDLVWNDNSFKDLVGNRTPV
uniref:Nucleocapsid n=1 Tax=Blechmonas ayalai leishbunyavirus 1 TaxID=2364197 RepID=A0A386ISA7_9VIRU|nr:nucleocapsid [Blechmonas ayalai leishbunyavirus 1]